MADITYESIQKEVWKIKELAISHGLDFHPVDFEIITKKDMVEFATYVLPSRYSHWTFGKDFGRLQKLHDLGILQILEMVINSNPARAFLLDSNTQMENSMVIAHVLAHCDFFKNNYWFSKSNQRMLDEAQFYEQRLRDLEFKHGKKTIENILDITISIQWYVNFYGMFEDKRKTKKVLPQHDYSKYQFNETPDKSAKDSAQTKKRDIIGFLINNAPLKDYEREILEIIESESLYFMPNALTKIMNEGWATYWHTELMKEHLDFDEFTKFSIKNATLLSTSGLNPYRLGYTIYNSTISSLGITAGTKKIFEIRKFEDDVSFIRNYLTQEICNECGLFIYDTDPDTGEKKIISTDVDDIKQYILQKLINLGNPVIVVADGDFKGNKELLLEHIHDNRELDFPYAEDVLRNIYKLWRRNVHLSTIKNEKNIIMSFDGKDIKYEEK